MRVYLGKNRLKNRLIWGIFCYFGAYFAYFWVQNGSKFTIFWGILMLIRPPSPPYICKSGLNLLKKWAILICCGPHLPAIYAHTPTIYGNHGVFQLFFSGIFWCCWCWWTTPPYYICKSRGFSADFGGYFDAPRPQVPSLYADLGWDHPPPINAHNPCMNAKSTYFSAVFL